MAIESLPAIHRDLFDRILLAQAQVEGITLLTADPVLAQYPEAVQLV
jgi:PIN domain nuclease of toxin-antitoxin system